MRHTCPPEGRPNDLVCVRPAACPRSWWAPTPPPEGGQHHPRGPDRRLASRTSAGVSRHPARGVTMTEQTPTHETIPDVWTAADEAFFVVVRDLFPPAFLAGAGVLLASNDDDIVAPPDTLATDAGHGTASATPVGTMV